MSEEITKEMVKEEFDKLVQIIYSQQINEPDEIKNCFENGISELYIDSFDE